jgi:hypothetical protein
VGLAGFLAGIFLVRHPIRDEMQTLWNNVANRLARLGK